MLIALRLALADLWHERRLNICGLIAYSSILAPLLILFGLKYGLLTSMTDKLLSDPLILEVIPVGAGRYDTDWFEKVQSWPEVAFVLPKTRSIATSVIVKHPSGSATRNLNAELLPTAEGDPLLRRAGILPPKTGQTVVSAEIAERLSLSADETLSVIVRRVINGRNEPIIQNLQISAVAPEAIYNRPALWTDFEFLFNIEQYRDGFAVPALGILGKPASDPRQPYASFRMYATNLDAVVKLRDKLRAAKIEARTQAPRIASMLSLSENVTLLFWVIASVASAGFVLSMGANLWASIERKTTVLSLAQLLGGKKRHLTLFPISQAVIMTASAFVLSTTLFWIIATMINWIYTSENVGEKICYIPTGNLAAAFAMSVLIAIIVGIWPANRVMKIEPSAGLKSSE